MHNPNVVIGFDYGTKRTGLAVGQMVTMTASPIATVRMRDCQPPWAQVLDVIKEWRPDCLVVGLPLNMDGTEQTVTELAKTFADELHQRSSLPVFLVDERLSTREVREAVFDDGGYKALQRADIDSLAAKVIIERWMREQSKGKA